MNINRITVNQKNCYNNKSNKNYDIISFGLKNPKAALYRAQILKAKFNDRGLSYVMPDEVWKGKKIARTVEQFGKKIEHLIESKNINQQTVQETIDSFLPESKKGSIKVKNLYESIEDFKKEGFSDKKIKLTLQKTALTTQDTRINAPTTIYLNFDNIYKNNFQTNIFQVASEHEFKHALTKGFQNINSSDAYKLGKNQNLADFMFGFFDNAYGKTSTRKPIKLTQKSLLKFLGFKSTKSLHKSFNGAINRILYIDTLRTKFIGSEQKEKTLKDIYTYLRHCVKDEKEAYSTSKGLRRLNNDLDTPTEHELRTLLYAEMEKFFTKKEHNYII